MLNRLKPQAPLVVVTEQWRGAPSPARATLHMHLFGDKRMVCADFLQNRDNIDCRHIGQLTPLMAQAMELGQGSNNK